jgi:putative transposase
MPWKTKNKQEQRYELVRAMRAGVESVAELSRRSHVSRKTAYKWLSRYRQGGLRGLLDQPRKPERVARRTPRYWLERLRRLRRQRPNWGTRKLHHRLGQEQGLAGLPAVATLSRWLKRWGMTKGRRPRRLCGPVLLRRAIIPFNNDFRYIRVLRSVCLIVHPAEYQ